ncbi:MAG: arylesterase [Desulfuromonas sp.]|nr:MAG: arylesterase [Desulfuromonas sp.]
MPFRSLLVLILFMLTVHTGAAADRNLFKIVALGDSLTAGYGLANAEALPAQLEAALQKRGHNVRVINAGVSGDTSAGGLRRLDWTLADNPDLVLLALGSNDALRGLDPEKTRANLDAIIEKIRQKGSQVLLAGMKAPRNLGPTYYTRFDNLYPELAEKHAIPFYPFFLEGVATRAEFNQADGIHPNARGVEIMVKNLLPVLQALLPAN